MLKFTYISNKNKPRGLKKNDFKKQNYIPFLKSMISSQVDN